MKAVFYFHGRRRTRVPDALLAVLMITVFATPSIGGAADNNIVGIVDADNNIVGADSNGAGVDDPLEPVNRVIFSFNQFARSILFKPLALLYRDLLPPPIQDAVAGILDTLRAPVTFANDLLQAAPGRAGETLSRFVINSTFGIAGIFDVAAKFGLKGHSEDFGQTLAVWGSGEGIYLVLPLLGPSDVRDTVGRAVDALFEPLTYYANAQQRTARTLVLGMETLAKNIDYLDNIERTSIDYYATLRSLYFQQRDNQIRNGAAPPLMPIPSISFDDFDDFDLSDEEQISQAD